MLRGLQPSQPSGQSLRDANFCCMGSGSRQVSSTRDAIPEPRRRTYRLWYATRLMAPDPSRELDELVCLERLFALPSDATPLQRALAYRPDCPAAGRYKNAVIAKLCNGLGIRPPWSAHIPRERWPAAWVALEPWR